jgi:3-oxoadipate enol-lactonase
MPFATLHGRRIHYTDTGGTGPALIFVHAYTCNASLWDAMVARLASQFRCLALDLPGHGLSDPNDAASSMAFLADCVVAVLDDAGVETAHMCGLSIGGMIGQHLGLSYANRMNSLTLACTTGALAPEAVGVWDERLDKITSKGMWAQIGETIERWYGAGLMDGFGPADLDPIARMVGATTIAGAVSCGLAVKAHDLMDRLGAITTPTLVIGADRDLSFPPEHPKALAAGIPGAQLVMLENAGHLAPVQVPDAFEAALRSFLVTH